MSTTMKRLAQLQNNFQSFILTPDIAQPKSWVSDQGRASAETRLNVYAHAYRSRLKEVLETDYPALAAAIGCERFNQLAEDYITHYPSSFFSLRDFGNRFPTHVADSLHGPAEEHTDGWLHELALFELRLGQAFDAADCTPVTEQAVAQIPPDRWPSLRVEFIPSLTTLTLAWNTPSLWNTLTSDQPTETEAVRGQASHWLIWRQELVTRFRSLEEDEQRMLDGLQRGGNFNEACVLLSALMNEEDVPLRAAGLLKSWLNQGLIASVNYR